MGRYALVLLSSKPLTRLNDSGHLQRSAVDASLHVGHEIFCDPNTTTTECIVGMRIHLEGFVDPDGGVAVRLGVRDDTTRSRERRGRGGHGAKR